MCKKRCNFAPLNQMLHLMACFVVPLTQAIATTIVRRRAQKSGNTSAVAAQLPSLELMLWGGSAMLIVDHIISGEVMPYFPFFSALLEEGGTFTMLREMLTVGVPMSLLVTAIWGVMTIAKLRNEK